MSFTYIHNFRNNILKVRPVYGNPNTATREIFACGIQNPAYFCRGIRNTAQGTRNPSTDWNPIQVPLTKNPVSSTSNQQSKTVLSNSLTWDEKSNIHRRGVSLSLACKQTLFYFSFRSFQKHRGAYFFARDCRTEVFTIKSLYDRLLRDQDKCTSYRELNKGGKKSRDQL